MDEEDKPKYRELEIPPLEIFTKNEYKKYSVQSIPSDDMDDIVAYNSVRRRDNELIFTNTLFGLLSFFNHDKKRNVFTDFI